MRKLRSFKPYYNWNTFNTEGLLEILNGEGVLNLVISGIPSIHAVVSGANWVALKF